MVQVTEPWDAGPRACSSWRVLPLLVLEALLLVVVLWRLAHHAYWKSHPRRVFFHAALLASSALRWVFWFSLCHVAQLYAVGMALLWWANSLLLLCTASIIVQWWCAVSAGRVAVRELQKVKRFSVTHPLVLLHLAHLACACDGGAVIIRDGLASADAMRAALDRRHVFLLLFRILSMATVLIDAVVALVVARKLRERLLAAAMADDLKHKSVVQMTLLIVALTAALLVQFAMDVPLLVTSVERGFGDLPFSIYAVIKYFVPAILLSGAFLYIMRRVEQRGPVRLVVMPAASSLVDYEECATPCMWCEHHRRYQIGQTKWDVNLMTSISPRTVDEQFRAHAQGHPDLAAHAGHAHGHSHGAPSSSHSGHAHGGPSHTSVSVLGGGVITGGNGTFPAELETPLGWSAALGDDFPVLTPQPGPSRTFSGRRIDAGLYPQPQQQSQQQQRKPRSKRSRRQPKPSRQQIPQFNVSPSSIY